MDGKTMQVRVLSGILAVLLSANAHVLIKKEILPEPRFTNSMETFAETIEAYYTGRITDTRILDHILGYKTVELESIYRAIDENTLLSPEERMLTKHFAHTLKEKYPTMDMRIYFENVKDLWFEALSKEEYECLYPDSGIAHFATKERRISFIEGASIETKYHELGHAAWDFDWTISGRRYFRTGTPSFIAEAMNNDLISSAADDNSYKEEGKIVGYLRSFDPEFQVEDYSRAGIGPLLDKLKSIYGKELIEKIEIESTKLYKEKRYDETFNKIEDYEDLVDACFKLAMRAVENDPNVLYRPFVNFIKILSPDEATFSIYLEKYNRVLESLGLATVQNGELNEKIAFASSIDTFLVTEDAIIPYARSTKENDTMTFKRINLPEYVLDDDYYPNYQRVYLDKNLWNIALKSSILLNGEIKIEDIIESLFFKSSYFKNRLGFETVDFVYDREVVYSNKIEDTMISIGVNPDGTRGCILYDIKNSEAIKEVYRTSEDLMWLSSPIRLIHLTKYISKNDGQVFLATLLDDYVLFDMNNPHSLSVVHFDNVVIEDYRVKIVKPIYLFIEGTYTASKLAYSYIEKVSPTQLVLLPSGLEISIAGNFPDAEMNLYQLFVKEGLLDDEDFLNAHTSKKRNDLFVLSEDELKTIIVNFIAEQNPKMPHLAPR